MMHKKNSLQKAIKHFAFCMMKSKQTNTIKTPLQKKQQTETN